MTMGEDQGAGERERGKEHWIWKDWIMVAKHVRRLSRVSSLIARERRRGTKGTNRCFYAMHIYVCMRISPPVPGKLCAYKIPQNNRSPEVTAPFFPHLPCSFISPIFCALFFFSILHGMRDRSFTIIDY